MVIFDLPFHNLVKRLGILTINQEKYTKGCSSEELPESAESHFISWWGLYSVICVSLDLGMDLFWSVKSFSGIYVYFINHMFVCEYLAMGSWLSNLVCDLLPPVVVKRRQAQMVWHGAPIHKKDSVTQVIEFKISNNIKLHHWLKIYGLFAKWVEFAFWWSYIGKSLSLQPAQQAFVNKFFMIFLFCILSYCLSFYDALYSIQFPLLLPQYFLVGIYCFIFCLYFLCWCGFIYVFKK